LKKPCDEILGEGFVLEVGEGLWDWTPRKRLRAYSMESWKVLKALTEKTRFGGWRICACHRASYLRIGWSSCRFANACRWRLHGSQAAISRAKSKHIFPSIPRDSGQKTFCHVSLVIQLYFVAEVAGREDG